MTYVGPPMWPTCVSNLGDSLAFTDDLANILTQLYKYFIHPHLEYCSIIWDPHLLRDIESLCSPGLPQGMVLRHAEIPIHPERHSYSR